MAYQKFVVNMLFLVHGTDGFTNLREVRDGGCDGILIKEACAIACYGPGKGKFAKERKKISDDYQSYKTRWFADFPNWRLFINHEPGPDHLALAATLHGAGDVVWGATRQCELIKQLNCGLRKEICGLLNIPGDVVARDFVQSLLDDLTSGRVQGNVIRYAKLAPDLERKIRANYGQGEVDAALRMAELTLEQQAEVAQAISNLTTRDTDVLKMRVLTDFSSALGQTFAERLGTVQRLYAARYNAGNDDEILGYIHALLIHVFAQCLFGLEPAPEAEA